MNGRLEIHTFGSLSIHYGSEPVTGLATRKAKALLVYLAANPRPHPREALADLLWEEMPQRHALTNLRVTLTGLRKQLSPYLSITRDSVTFKFDTPIWLDFLELEGHLDVFRQQEGVRSVAVAEQLELAFDLYRGEFLEGFFVSNARGFEQWAVQERERLHHLVLDALRDAIAFDLEIGTYKRGIKHARRLLQLDPIIESAHRQMMQLLAKSGQRQAALQQYETCCQLLKDELGIEPEAETIALFRRIKKGELISSEEPPQLPTAKLPEPLPHGIDEKPVGISIKNGLIQIDNLPASPSVFIGRNREISEIKNLLSEHRMLTLTGTGGSGKTRLALRVASELHADYQDGIWLTEFTSLADGNFVPQAIATTLDVREQPGRLISETLTGYLQSRTTLLVLDNCEHLVAACAQLSATLLEGCPDVRLLTTSREPLGVPGEAVWVVPPLSLPDPLALRNFVSDEENFTAFKKSEAIQLFAARAREASQDFKLTAQNAPWVADVCRLLDGMPLAIELAAAHLRAFSVRQIAERLDNRFVLLTRRRRTGHPRHHTLEATLDWSYALLSHAEQKALQRLSIFADGWTLEAAEAVSAGNDIRQSEVMHLLSNLVDKSLVVVDSSPGSRRYRLLESIRQYALQKLTKVGETDMVRDRHLDFFLSWAESNAPRLYGPDQLNWLGHFEAEHENLRTALNWSLRAEGSAEGGLRLAVACGPFWSLRSHSSEARERLSAALDRAEAQEQTEVRVQALLWSALLAHMQSDYPAEKILASEALDLSRGLGPAGFSGVASALDRLGEVAIETGNYETASSLFEEALTIQRELRDKSGIAEMLIQLGWAAMRVGDYKRAEALLNECLPLYRELNQSASLGLVLSALGELAVRQRRFDQANDLLEESLVLRRKLGDRRGTAKSLGSLGWVALLQRDFNRMRERLGESLEIRLEIGDQGGIAWCLEKLAGATALRASTLPDPHSRPGLHRAVCIFGAAAVIRAALNSVIDKADQPEYERILEDLRSGLGDEAFAAAWEEGGTTPLPKIIDLALMPGSA